MKIEDLIRELQKYPADANARAYEGEVCGIVIESVDLKGLAVIHAHESDDYTSLLRTWSDNDRLPGGR